ncbi:hypothetical protein [Marinobacter sp. ATCH36]|uniref:hypothetical protein n=1 Tax=Marinobacter sp. ATCH36 TaxID=2945106 RepID=UPI0020213CA8|nr:hypothetical protein [Marinobacter sp. ATCH36]MCL7942966.1 hypothetical protein [Marinobacter sp. ATCH36]
MGGLYSSRAAIGVATLVVALSPLVWAQTSEDTVAGGAFNYEERSTLETIPFNSMEEESLANTVIEGGLEAPAAGVPDFYLDPLALQPRDPRTDLGRNEIPVEFRFSNPKSIPGQTHGDNYIIRPPTNRSYGAFNTTTTER